MADPGVGQVDELDKAYHEAGHAVVAWRLGRRFSKVTMTELVRNGGEEIDTCAKAKTEIMIEVAGALGEHLFRGGKLLVHKGDMCRARNIAKWHRGDKAST